MGDSTTVVTTVDRHVTVIATGPLPAPSTESLRAGLDDAGLADVDVLVRLVPEERVELPGN